ncbi:hypothetical protein SRHO_G00326920 [Serrasalmus rhombeus]
MRHVRLQIPSSALITSNKSGCLRSGAGNSYVIRAFTAWTTLQPAGGSRAGPGVECQGCFEDVNGVLKRSPSEVSVRSSAAEGGRERSRLNPAGLTDGGHSVKGPASVSGASYCIAGLLDLIRAQSRIKEDQPLQGISRNFPALSAASVTRLAEGRNTCSSNLTCSSNFHHHAPSLRPSRDISSSGARTQPKAAGIPAANAEKRLRFIQEEKRLDWEIPDEAEEPTAQ